MKRKFYHSYDDGTIEFDPPVEGQALLLSDFLPADKLAQLHIIDDEDLVQRYSKAARECYDAEQAIHDNSIPPEDPDA
ncbi:hypothetical protein LCGC14_0709610 [marine sediment metagenome]|uniref:Uncharacterized protein n=1 Tax=marine sediment metagenome TaxID=412755 RepID=A0A0F9QK57_9ZZZZ